MFNILIKKEEKIKVKCKFIKKNSGQFLYCNILIKMETNVHIMGNLYKVTGMHQYSGILLKYTLSLLYLYTNTLSTYLSYTYMNTLQVS